MEFCFNGMSNNGNSMWKLFFVHIVIGLGTELFGQLSWWYIDIDGWWYDYKCVIIISYSWIHLYGHFLDVSPISLRGLFRKTPIICEWLHDHSPAVCLHFLPFERISSKVCHFIGKKILQKRGALVSDHGTVTQRRVNWAKVAVTLKRCGFSVCPGLSLG